MAMSKLKAVDSDGGRLFIPLVQQRSLENALSTCYTYEEFIKRSVLECQKKVIS